jgi:hypothetical protein
MDMTDNIKDKMGDMSDEARQRFNELRQKEQDGQLDDNARDELQQMRDRYGL